MRKAYSYLRFSTPEQAKGDSHRRQSELARTYAARNDLDLDDNLTFHDLGVSAFRGANAAETGKLGQFKAAVEQGLVPAGSVLLVESLDRISRQAARKALRVLEDVVDAGVSVVTLADNREYDREALDRDPGALLMALLIFIRANEESEMKSRRGKASWAGRRAKAAEKPITSRGPAWLQLGDDRKWQIVEDRADVVRRIFTLAASGAGELSIAATLNRDKVATWGDNGRAPAVMWHKSYVSKILTSRAVIGTLVPMTMVHEGARKSRQAGTPVEGYYPPIVSDSLWSAVRTLKATASPLRGRHAVKPVQNILGGLARCSECGRAMTRVSKGSAAKAGVPKLICTGAKTGAGCDYVGMPLDIVEETLNRDFRSLANGDVLGATWKAGVQEALATHQVKIDRIEARIDRLLSGDVDVSNERVWQMIKRLSDIKDTRLEEQENMRNIARDMAEPVINKYIDALEGALGGEIDRTAANVALRQLFAKVEVNATTGRLAFQWKSGEVTALQVEVPTVHDRLSGNAKRQRRTTDGRYQPRAV